MPRRTLLAWLVCTALILLGANPGAVFSAYSGYVRAEWYAGPRSKTCGIAEAISALLTFRSGGTVYLAPSNVCRTVSEAIDLDGEHGTNGLQLVGAGAGNSYVSETGTVLEWKGPSASGSGLSLTLGPAGKGVATIARSRGDFVAEGVQPGMFFMAENAADRCPFTNPANCSRQWRVVTVTQSIVTVEDPADVVVAEGPVSGVDYLASPCMFYTEEWSRGLTLRDFSVRGHTAACFLAARPCNETTDGQTLAVFENLAVFDFLDNHLQTGFLIDGRGTSLVSGDQFSEATWTGVSIEAGRCIYVNSVQSVNNQLFSVSCRTSYRGIELERGEVNVYAWTHTTIPDRTEWALYVHSTAHRFALFGGYFELGAGSQGLFCGEERTRPTLVQGARWYLQNGTPRDWVDCRSRGPVHLDTNVFEVNRAALRGNIRAPNTSAYLEAPSTFIDETGALDATILGARTLPPKNWRWMDNAGSGSSAPTW